MLTRALRSCRQAAQARKICLSIEHTVEEQMKILSTLVLASAMLCGCISSGSPNPPEKTTVVVPPGSTTTVVCQDGSRPPCN
jgi:hypothetical protein